MYRSIYIFLLSLDKGKPTTIRSSIYVESFGNIEEANMVRTCKVFKQYANIPDNRILDETLFHHKTPCFDPVKYYILVLVISTS